MIGRRHKRQRRRTRKVESLIGHNVRIQGDVEFSGGLYVEGHVVGNVRAIEDSTAVLMVASKGVIEGEVSVPNLVLNGELRGEVHLCQWVELGETARLSGHLHYKSLQVSEGADIAGRLECVDEPLQGVLEEPMPSEGESVADRERDDSVSRRYS